MYLQSHASQSETAVQYADHNTTEDEPVEEVVEVVEAPEEVVEEQGPTEEELQAQAEEEARKAA